MNDAPEVIYLQWSGGEHDEDNTWCVDQTNDDDVEYIKKATADRRGRLLERLNKERLQLGSSCWFCQAYPWLEHGKFEDSHATDCELAKELAGE